MFAVCQRAASLSEDVLSTVKKHLQWKERPDFYSRHSHLGNFKDIPRFTAYSTFIITFHDTVPVSFTTQESQGLSLGSTSWRRLTGWTVPLQVNPQRRPFHTLSVLGHAVTQLDGWWCQSAGAPLRSRLKHLNNYLRDYQQISKVFRGWVLLTFPLIRLNLVVFS